MDNRPYHRSDLFVFVLLAAASLPLCSSQLSSVVDPAGFFDIAGNATGSPRDVYIVHVQRPGHILQAGPDELEKWHMSFLPTPLLDSGEPRMVFSYDKAISGFAARLTPREVEAIQGIEGVLAVHLDEPLVFQTTYTPDFMGLRRNGDWLAPNRGEDIIIGVVDSGVNPTHDSFDDTGMRNPPAKWNGQCEFNGMRTCNKKLLGARNFDIESKKVDPLPYDTVGHGTHVAGTAAGAARADANIKGLALGTASGAAPRAHLSVYKARTKAEALKAVDQAILDRIDILSMSLFATKPGLPFYKDDLAIAALSAVKHGILVSACAANFGPGESTMRNDAPWMLTVGATTTDRVLKTTLSLAGKHENIHAESLYTGKAFTARLVYPGRDGDRDAKACRNLRGEDVSQMIVLCHTDVDKGFRPQDQAEVIKALGGKAMILMNSEERGNTISGIPNVGFPVIRTDYGGSSRIVDYVKNERQKCPTAQVSTTATAFNGPHPSPAVAFFSSRGPSTVNKGIPKPDVVGPGVNVLAASASSDTGFVLMSGTSMATPHLAGVAAILKRSHEGWTPAMIKSALMTTADTSDSRGEDITDEKGTTASLHAVGSGQVNPLKARLPGLVYKLEYKDYLKYLCGLDYSDEDVSIIARETVKCGDEGKIEPEELNYPSIWVTLKLDGKGRAPKKTVSRKVMSVEGGRSLYKPEVQLSSPDDVGVDVDPKDKLEFTGEGQQKEYKVTFTLKPGAQSGEVRGRLRWVSRSRDVSIPLLITIV